MELDAFAEAVMTSKNWSQLAKMLGYSALSGNILAKLKKETAKRNLCTSHFTMVATRPVAKYTAATGLIQFPAGSPRLSGRLLTRLLLELGRPYVCEECQLAPTWNGKTLLLQVDHRDGDILNNQPKNVRFLCPNCHTQTHNWGGKNSKKKTNDWTTAKAPETTTRPVTRKQLARISLVAASGIDFAEWGWVSKVAYVLGIKPQKVSGWLQRYMPEQYSVAVTRADRVNKNRVHSEKIKREEKELLRRRVLEAEEEFITGYGWLSRLAAKWNIDRAAARRWVMRHVPRLYSMHKKN